MRLVYTKNAVEDLSRLRSFMAERNPQAAGRAARDLLLQMEKLMDFPKIGKPVEMAPDPSSLRDLIFGPYRIRYSLHKDMVIILAVWHSREGKPDD